MATTAKSVIQRCTEELFDETSIRWTVAELVRYLNDGQREIVLYRPDSTATTASLALAAGARQTLPAAASKLLYIERNTSGKKRVVTNPSWRVLIEGEPEWESMATSLEIQHYAYDVRVPTQFLVYPPATLGASLEIVYSAYPANITEPAANTTFEAVTGSISVSDIFANPLRDYIVFRALSKDTEFAGNAVLAQARYNAFASALGIDASVTQAVGPYGPLNQQHAAIRMGA